MVVRVLCVCACVRACVCVIVVVCVVMCECTYLHMHLHEAILHMYVCTNTGDHPREVAVHTGPTVLYR